MPAAQLSAPPHERTSCRLRDLNPVYASDQRREQEVRSPGGRRRG
ncbi:hypothetical protein FM106_24640 [Brachybacterium faecium]|nr:hypothetical protein FM106_24640 [Brachybacterium faecium]